MIKLKPEETFSILDETGESKKNVLLYRAFSFSRILLKGVHSRINIKVILKNLFSIIKTFSLFCNAVEFSVIFLLTQVLEMKVVFLANV